MHFRHISAKIQPQMWNNITIGGGAGFLWLRHWKLHSSMTEDKRRNMTESNF